MKHADEDTRLTNEEQSTLDLIQAGPQTGEKVPVPREVLSWLAGIAPAGPRQAQAAAAPQQAEAAAPQQAEAAAAGGDSVPKKAPDSAAVKEEKIPGDLFVKGGGDPHEVDISDVRQGDVGDCYFLAVLAAIARLRPEFIKGMVKDNGDGTYTVTFHTHQGLSGLFGSRSNQSVTVDGTFWTDGSGNPTYAKKGDTSAGGNPELWVMVIEKAWAQLNGGYGNITGSKLGGEQGAVTGKDPQNIDPSDFSAAELDAKLEEAWKAKRPVIFWSHGEGSEKKLAKAGVITNHEYALNNAGGGKYTLYNPWGYQHLESIDAAFIKLHFQKIRLLSF